MMTLFVLRAVLTCIIILCTTFVIWNKFFVCLFVGKYILVWLMLRNFSTSSRTTSQNIFISHAAFYWRKLDVYHVLCWQIFWFFRKLRNCWEKVENFGLVKINFYRFSGNFSAYNLPLGITSHVQQLIIYVFSSRKKEGWAFRGG